MHAASLTRLLLRRQVLGRYPDDLSDASEQSVGRGRLIPELPLEAVWNPVARWFGVPEASLGAVLPNLPNFPEPVLLSRTEVFEDGT